MRKIISLMEEANNRFAKQMEKAPIPDAKVIVKSPKPSAEELQALSDWPGNEWAGPRHGSLNRW